MVSKADKNYYILLEISLATLSTNMGPQVKELQWNPNVIFIIINKHDIVRIWYTKFESFLR